MGNKLILEGKLAYEGAGEYNAVTMMSEDSYGFLSDKIAEFLDLQYQWFGPIQFTDKKYRITIEEIE